MNGVEEKKLPEKISAIKECGYINWSTENDLSPEFKNNFEDSRISVSGIRYVRQWGLQVDDERELMGHERTSINDEDLWEIILVAKNGSTYEVNSKFVVPASDK